MRFVVLLENNCFSAGLSMVGHFSKGSVCQNNRFLQVDEAFWNSTADPAESADPADPATGSGVINCGTDPSFHVRRGSQTPSNNNFHGRIERTLEDIRGSS